MPETTIVSKVPDLTGIPVSALRTDLAAEGVVRWLIGEPGGEPPVAAFNSAL